MVRGSMTVEHTVEDDGLCLDAQLLKALNVVQIAI